MTALSWTTIVVHNRDDQEVTVVHKEAHTSIFPDDDGAELVKTGFQIDPKCFQKVAMEF